MTKHNFTKLFSPIQIGNLKLKNRIVSTGHETHLCENGQVGDRMIAYHEARARAGVGLIVTEAALIHPSAVFVANPIRLDTDDCIPGYQKLAEAVHKHDCGLIAQLFHPGREIIASEDGTIPVSYSASTSPHERFRVIPRQMPLALVEDVISHYGDAASRMARANVDGVEIVASHGYLPIQFLNPSLNTRDDHYGGSLENRLRFIREVAANIRAKTSKEFVIGLRLSGLDQAPDGLGLEDMVNACELLSNEGVINYLSVVAGSSASLGASIHIVPPMTQEVGYTAPLAKAIKQRTSIPVIVTGRINQPQIAETILADGSADLCGMTRAMISDSEMPSKAYEGRLDDIRACIGCNQACIGHFQKGFPISCIQNPVSGREVKYGNVIKAATSKKIMVIGGGPAGMKAAAVAAGRGHSVTLFEKSSQLGGQVLLAQLLPTRVEFGGLVTNLKRELVLNGVSTRMSTEVDTDLVMQEKPDAIILATGATPRWPDFEGCEDMHVVDAWQVLNNQVNVGGSVVVADWSADWIGIGISETLAKNGHRVCLAVNGYMPGEKIQSYVRDIGVGRLHDLGVEMIPYVNLYGTDGDTVYLRHAMSREPIIRSDVDTLVLCQGHMPVDSLESDLQSLGLEMHLIGDCLSPRTAEEAVLEGFRVAVEL
jgi:2,4-dienoyl-CoA reductase-like NADH-dependent reductase (Old Yellow Enzyme family)